MPSQKNSNSSRKDNKNKKNSNGYWTPFELMDLGLSRTEAALLHKIHLLSSEGYCFATNNYLASEFRLSVKHISDCISKLKKLKLLEQISFCGRVRKIKCLYENWHLKDEFSKNYSSVKSATSIRKVPEKGVPPPPIIDNIPILETTTKKSVVVFDCVKDLGLRNEDQIALSRYPEQKVKEAIDSSKKVKINTTLIRYLIWYCVNDIKPMVTGQSIEANRDYATEFFLKNCDKIRCSEHKWNMHEKCLIIGNDQISFNQTHHVFDQQFKSALRKCELCI